MFIRARLTTKRKPTFRKNPTLFSKSSQKFRLKICLLLGSDILAFEVHNILSEEKRAKVKDYLAMCNSHIESSEEVVNLGKRIQSDCHIRARDALHIASAIFGQARYFLSCDKKVTEMKQARCYHRLAKPYRTEYFSAMNPILFVDKMKKGEIE